MNIEDFLKLLGNSKSIRFELLTEEKRFINLKVLTSTYSGSKVIITLEEDLD